MSEREWTRGRRIVALMYAASVTIAGVFGYVLGVIIYGNGGTTNPVSGSPPPQYGQFGPITFQLNGPNLALFGVVMVGTILGVGLAAIVYVSRRENDL